MSSASRLEVFYGLKLRDNCHTFCLLFWAQDKALFQVIFGTILGTADTVQMIVISLEAAGVLS
jgi:hypothetical protein